MRPFAIHPPSPDRAILDAAPHSLRAFHPVSREAPDVAELLAGYWMDQDRRELDVVSPAPRAWALQRFASPM